MSTTGGLGMLETVPQVGCSSLRLSSPGGETDINTGRIIPSLAVPFPLFLRVHSTLTGSSPASF